jgi:hypothetical protein
MKVLFLTGTKVLATAITTVAAVVAAIYAVKGTLDTEHFIKAQKARWETEDRPRVVASLQGQFPGGAVLTPTGAAVFTLTNTGVEEATKIKITFGSTDLLHQHILTHGVYEIPTLRHGDNQKLSIYELAPDDADFSIVCVAYSNISNDRFADPAKFYSIRSGQDDDGRPIRFLNLVAPLDDAKLSDGFSCDQLVLRCIQVIRSRLRSRGSIWQAHGGKGESCVWI